MRLWLKILLATAAVILICLTVVGLLAGVSIRRQFDHFVQTQEQNVLQQFVAPLTNYYQRNRSWTGVEDLLQMGRGRMMGTGMQGMRFLLLDSQGQVLLDTRGDLDGQTLPDQVRQSGLPIVVDGDPVGWLVSGASLTQSYQRSLIEQRFLRSMAVALIVASLLGGLAAIVVATILALQITAPARQLTQAAQRIAAGDLEQRVALRSDDELGEVGSAFNNMAAALARQEEIRRHMVADIAHELRTPLSVMQVELASLQDGLSQPTPEVVDSLSEEVDLLSRLVEDLRLLSLMDAGRLDLQRESVDLAELLPLILQQIGTTAERKGIVLEYHAAGDLPPAHADRDRLRQVLLNLLSNALRHTPAGGQVRLSAQEEGADLRVQVNDSGEGIDPQDLPHIFERFYRADNSRARASGGSGLGLSIARGLVEAMGGQIWAESAPGQGTTIRFTLPRAPGA